MLYRLLKPEWAKNNPDFGPNTIEGIDFSPEFLKEKNDLGYGVFFFPNYNSKPVPKDEYLSGRHIDTFEWCYVDMDLKDGVYATKEDFIEKVLQFPVMPNNITLSGNGVHVYWRIKDLDREKFILTQLRLIRHFNTDKSIWTVLRLMRLGGYYNTKNKDNFKMVEIDHIHDDQYSARDLAKHLPALTTEDEKKMAAHLRKIDGLEQVENLEDIDMENLPPKFEKLMDKNKEISELFFDESGDRSENDYKLTAILYENDFTKKEAIGIISNTPKSRSLGAEKLSYVLHTVNKVFKTKAKHTVPSIAEKMRENKGDVRRGREIHGPAYLDCTYKGWRTQQCLGIVGGPGIGKSTISLDIFKSIIENNPNSDDICIYFNLEMTDWEIIEKWSALTNGDPKMAERLYVVSNEDDEGNARNINLQQIHWFTHDIHKSTGKKVAAIAIDHIGVINPTIDIRKKPTFGLIGEMEGAFGDLRNVSARKMPQLLKELAKSLDCFLIIQSQTTKAKGMDGDTPLGIDAAYGASQFEQFMDYVISIWQPLRRVHKKTDMRVMGFQYCKIRSKDKRDGIDTYIPHMLTVNVDTGALAALTMEEEDQFQALEKEATLLRKKTEKKEGIEYKNARGLKKLKAIIAARA